MTNSLRGAVAFEVDGMTMQLRITTNAQVAYQDAMGETFLKGMVALENDPTDMRRLRALAHHAIEGASCASSGDKTGEIIDAVGIPEMIRLLSSATMAAFPAPKKDAPGNGQGAAKPRKMTAN